ncbi:hypothetical protein LCGC14_3097140 [marine sediment metagenome]|uniref:Uncharacterized protein n=1 Tax=marine sediment metagenome TaxID=412755 RepID=A0A0F8W9B1_9ZZZZ
MRKCKRCKQEKLESKFYKLGLGLTDNCKDCADEIDHKQILRMRIQNLIYSGLEKP